MDITVNFNENVDLVGGDLVLTLNSGGSVNITPFNNSNSATVTYTVGATDNSSDLGVSSIALSAGTLKMLLKFHCFTNEHHSSWRFK